ncbi:outer membrane beta-barrel protein [Carboxylicivirga sp. RSCT41]|uniref:outer membrane beta-barrel protein n=1 Tax=Carboxylicivirga agarovorans TaxID=3417570 RepID=UPI003D33D69F
MLNGGKNIDTVFKDGLSNHEVAPEAYVWESIEKNMNKQRRQAAVLIMWRSVAAACIVALMAVSFMLLNRVSEPLVEQTAEVMAAKKTEIAEQNSEAGKHTYIENQVNLNEAVIPEIPEKVLKNADDSAAPTPSLEDRHVVNKDAAIANYIASISAVSIAGTNEVNTDLHIRQEKVYYSIYNPLNAPSDFAKSSKKTSISIGGVLSPSYNSKMTSGGNESVMAASGVDVNENGINSLGGGLQVRVNTGSRWSFETGVLYAQVGQEVSNDYSYQSYKQAFLSRNVAISAGLSNSMGNVRITKPGPQAYAEPLTDNLVEASNTFESSVSSLKQTLDYIEIPMMARYSLFKNFPYLSVAGGISSNFLVDNAAYALDGGSERKIGETDDIKSFVLSSSIGLGVDVPIYKSIHLNVEPRLKYFLNSVSSNDDYNFQPYSFGVYGGLTFVIK